MGPSRELGYEYISDKAVSCEKVKDAGLVSVCESFRRNLARAHNLRSAYYHLIMPEMKSHLELETATTVMREWNQMHFHPEGNFFEAAYEEARVRIRQDENAFVRYLVDGAHERMR